MREHVSPANLITSASLCAGFLALLSVERSLGLTAALVGLAAVLDLVDGALARRSGCDRRFGAQLDSLADLVCFGVVPAYAVYVALLSRLPVAGVVVCLLFVVAGAWRLARFPLVQRSDRFIGLPIPAAGLAVVLLALWMPVPAVAAVLAVGLSALMISTVPFPTVGMIAGAIPRPPAPRAGLRRVRRRRPPVAGAPRTHRRGPVRPLTLGKRGMPGDAQPAGVRGRRGRDRR